MEEIKIWAIDGSEVTEVQRTDQTESEQWLEENLVSKPELLIPGLDAGRSADTDGGRPTGPARCGQRRSAGRVRA